MKNNASLVYNLFLIVGDFLALVAAFGVAYILRVTLSDQPFVSIPALTYLMVFLALLPFWLIIFALLGLYNSSIYEKRFSELGRLLTGSFIGLLFVIAADFVSDKPIFPARLVPVYGFGLAFIFVVIFRNLARLIRVVLFGYNIGLTNVLIIGDTKITQELVESLIDSRRSGYRVLGVVGTKRFTSKRYPDLAVFNNFAEAIEAIGNDGVHSILHTELYADEQRNREILEHAQANHVGYRFVPGNTELFVGNIDVELFRSSIPVIAVHQTPLFGWGRVAKRLFDIGFSLVMLVLLLPLLLLISLLIVVFDPGPIFFRQERITRFNTRFYIYKFRSNKKRLSGRDPVTVFKELGRDDLAQAWLKGEKIKHDPRLSAIGAFLRRYSLDELPQLLNVLKGDLSLVGPRAVLAEELRFYEGKDPLLLSVKTGITGLAQVSGRNNLDYYERAKLDLYYVQNWTFWLDVVILLKTARVVIDKRGVRG